MELGKLLATAGVANLMAENDDFARHVSLSLARYLSHDWGDLEGEDWRTNEMALASGEQRIFAAYKHPEHDDWRIWIITEWDRSVTTILFPDEY